ncbi:peptide/nickel transport system permease protein [Aminobacter niigataensis]|uniref:Peptide/nickel transport system permease protein n=2 Tax=Aminobacter niigataensis TaxID=83265 RepID=A0ABR6KVI0_9HYPH|nr:peptide/nickel transport system permease protein [Aminobacter niigataensis]
MIANSVLRRMFTRTEVWIGVIVIFGIVAISLLAPLLFPRGPWAMGGRPFLPPMSDMRFPLGTDTTGRDILAGLVWGGRVSLLIGLVSTVVSVFIGVVIGAIAGYGGGHVDSALMRFTEIFQVVPSFALALVLVAVLQPSVGSIVMAIGIVSWPPVARLVRAEFLSLRSRDFVLAAKLQGQSALAIMFRQILPNVASPIIVMGSLMVATAILLESSLSFLGLGDPNQMSWGFMIGASRTVLRQAWWMATFPGLAIAITVLALNVLGEALNDALNIHSRNR